MERSSKLVDLALVSKYYPVANYSYPRHDHHHGLHSDRTSGERDRSSLGSEGSAPGLIDDRGSEASYDDDYQYHAHGTEIWDSFWSAKMEARQQARQQQQQQQQKGPMIHPRKQYPALIPSPQRRQKPQQLDNGQPSPSWPLPDHPPQLQRRKPAASYSPFPRPPSQPPRPSPPSPSWQSSRPSTPVYTKPQRPPRPDERLLTPCIRQPAPVTAALHAVADRPSTPAAYRPMSTTETRPTTSVEQRPATSLGHRPSTPSERGNSISAASDPGVTDMAAESSKRFLARRMAKKSCPALRSQTSEPHSVFEHDDDSDSESHGRSFFKFHKRSDSDTKKSAKKSLDSPTETCFGDRRRRNRSSTVPPASRKQHDHEQTHERHSSDGNEKVKDAGKTPRRKRSGGAEVLGRMLGLRGRQ